MKPEKKLNERKVRVLTKIKTVVKTKDRAKDHTVELIEMFQKIKEILSES
jgi:hypothetical protein